MKKKAPRAIVRAEPASNAFSLLFIFGMFSVKANIKEKTKGGNEGF